MLAELKKTTAYRIYRRFYLQSRRLVFGERVLLDRIVLNRESDKLIATLSVGSMDALEISGDRLKTTGFRSYLSLSYPDYDVCAGPLDQTFDLIVADQVFEHLLYPHRAARNVYAMLRPGGYFLISTPFLQKIHNHPVDCSRWTETGIKYLLADVGFSLEDVKTGSWGNRIAAKANIHPKKFPIYNPLLHRSLANDPMFPVQVWALARRQ